jgi:hypothetical protein
MFGDVFSFSSRFVSCTFLQFLHGKASFQVASSYDFRQLASFPVKDEINSRALREGNSVAAQLLPDPKRETEQI